ncbi:MotA/TolQ/ExbB proton channel family protein [Porticoccus sp.]|uniref:MotA/TolQ/ExbB proton channel family protein n=1 Tax=Porticoccus sp. TaxID=2024853 RepID=UPI003F69F155
MNRSFLQSLLLGFALLLPASGAVQAEDAASLDELLTLIKNARLSESREQSEREAAFRRARSERAELLKQAKAELAAEERRSETLEKTFAENEIKVAALREQLQTRLGSLREMFGHLTAAAGDTRTTLNNSLVSAQYPDRTDFLDDMIERMSGNTRLPSLDDIEQLWYEINREMIEGGRVVSFPATVVTAEGERVQQQVVRVGLFNLLSNGAYLHYPSGTGMITELPRQPGRDYRKAAQTLQAAKEGFTRTGIDPTGPSGGTLLSALMDSPGWLERWHQGGWIGYLITALGVIALLLAGWRFAVLSIISRRVTAQLNNPSADLNNPLGRVLKVGEDHRGADAESLELKLHEQVLKERPTIESGLGLLKIIAMVAPLMGLLGTVTGMIVTFQAITLFGTGDPKTMAGGISAALVTTVLGLCVAIPTVLLHALINSPAQRVLHILEEQSAGIVAEQTEA